MPERWRIREQKEVALSVLLLPEVGIGDRAGSVIDSPHQGEHWPPPFQPGMAAAVDLKEHAFLGHPLPSAAMLGRPASARTGHTGRGEDAPD